MQAVETVASLQWENAELKALHHALSDEMKREVVALARLHEERARAAA
jgi:FtsZ-binding cell division protein ZapB